MDTESSTEEDPTSSSSSSTASTTSECTTDTESSSDDEKLETAQICGIRLQLPQGLCERTEIFREFFSLSTWNQLSEIHKQHLKSFLPTFPDNEEHERNVTLQKLFNGDVFRFGSPLMEFHEHLKAGHCRPDIAKMRMLIKKAERNEAKYRHRLHRDRLNGDVSASRQRLLNLVKHLPPGVEPRMERVGQNAPSYINPIAFRTKRRYFQELALIREAVDERATYSSDENYPEGAPTALSRKQKRHLNTIRNSLANGEKITNTLAIRQNHLDLEKYVTPVVNPFTITEETYRNMLLCHKKRRVPEDSDPEYEYSQTTVLDVINRTDLSAIKKFNFAVPPPNSVKPPPKKKPKREPPRPVSISPELLGMHNHPMFGPSSHSELDTDSDTIFDSLTNKPRVRSKKARRGKPVPPAQVVAAPQLEPKLEPVEVYCKQEMVCDDSPSPEKVSNYEKITAATFADLDGIDMMNLPIDLDDSHIDLLDLHHTKHELMQDTHANFLALIRDVICSTDEHRMSKRTLEEHLHSWQENPISPLNDWFSLSENWVPMLASAINFLSGNCTEQPDDFVPYIEYKAQIDSYQWIGAGRDSDVSLSHLCDYWLRHRAHMRPTLPAVESVKEEEDVEVSDRAQTPPPPRCPTTWTVRRAAMDDVVAFQEQERKRYHNPHRAFTFRCNGYESVVGPVKGIYSNQNIGVQKARGHSMLTADRPNYVTILTLVRDATARLPNGEGTRAEIVELLKCSQYISANAADNVLQSVVSGALDRMHTQFDPCVKYEPKRKLWIYLHRNRTEEDFERIHQQYQGVNRTGAKKSAVSKAKQPPSSSSSTSHRSKAKVEKAVKKEKSSAPEVDGKIVEVEASAQNHKVPAVTKIADEIIRSQSPVCKPHNATPPPPPPPPLPPPPIQIVQEAAVKTEVTTTASPTQRIIPVAKAQSKAKNFVKIITANQAKSLMAANSSNTSSTSNATTVLKPPENRLAPTKAPLTQQQQLNQQLLQTIVAQQKQLLLQKQNAEKAAAAAAAVAEESKMIITQVPNPNVKRNPISIQSIVVQSAPPPIVTTTMAAAVSTNHVTTPEQEIKVQTKLTPLQQQQILQTLRQKVLPLQQTTTMISPQFRTVAKQQQKPTVIQVQKQLTTTAAAAAASLLGQAARVGDGTPKTITGPTPLVAKVLTNAAGQVISVESLLAQQKQHGFAQGATLRLAGTKTPNIIQLTAPVQQNSTAAITVNSINQPKFVVSTPAPATTLATTTVTVARPAIKTIAKTQTATKLTPKIAQQLVNAKFVAQNLGQKIQVQPKIVVGQPNQIKIPISTKNITLTGANTGTIRMVNAGSLNLAQIGGKPVLITSKSGPFQNIHGQNIIIQTQANTASAQGGQQSLIITSADKANATSQTNQVLLSPQMKVQQAPQMVLTAATAASGATATSTTAKPAAVALTTPQNLAANSIVLGGQPLRLQTGGNTNTHRVVLTSQNQGQIITQQILLPVGFQGTPLNIKTLQGLKVVPIAQTQSRGLPGRQLFTRVVNPGSIVRVSQQPEGPDLSNVSKSTAD